MTVEFVGRSIVCLTAMQPPALDFSAFESNVGLQRPSTQVTNPQIAIAEYDRFQLVLPPDGRLQANFAPNASRDLCRRVAHELLRQGLPYGSRGVGFNAAVRIDQEQDPVAPLLDAEAIRRVAGEGTIRAGVKLVYMEDDARLTLDVAPVEDDEMAWVASINRHYPFSPDPPTIDAAVSWFAALNDELPRLVRTLVGDSNADL